MPRSYIQMTVSDAFVNAYVLYHVYKKLHPMLYIVLHGSEVVGVMTSPVDAALVAKPLQAQIWTCQPNSCDAKPLQ